MDVHQSSIVLEFKSLTWQQWRIYISKTVFPTILYGPQFTCQYLIEKSIRLLSPWKLEHSLCQTICVRPPLVEMLFIVFFYCLCEYAAHSNYWLFYFHILYLTGKSGCKLVYWDMNSFLPARFEPCEKKNFLSITCSCARNIHYTSSILGKIMGLIQLFSHMLFSLKALL